MECKPEHLRIITPDGRSRDLAWDAVMLGPDPIDAELEVLEGDGVTFVASGRPLSAAVLSSAPPTARQRLLPQAAQQDRKAQRERGLWARAVVVLVTVLACCGLALQALPWLVVREMPPSVEEALGQMNVPQQGVVTQGAAYDAVHAVWDRLSKGLQPNPYHFRLYVVESSVVNAFAAPGGTVVVYTALLKMAQSPEELAGVLGHESQHVIQRHTLKAMVRSVELGAMVHLLMGDADRDMRNMSQKLTSLAYSRQAEAQADSEGCNVLYRAHIDPHGLEKFFERLQEKYPTGGPAFLSDHPSTPDRMASLNQQIAAYPPEPYEPIQVDWKQVQEALK
ncbi:MAG: M48 family metallopeptidase [Candidatus Xenobia bacterium]